MKKIYAVLAIVAGAMFAFASGAQATNYPPTPPPYIYLPTNAVAGENFNVSIDEAKPFERINVTINGLLYTGAADANGSATISVPAPTKSGRYPVYAVMVSTGQQISAMLDVTKISPPTIPGGPTTTIAGGGGGAGGAGGAGGGANGGSGGGSNLPDTGGTGVLPGVGVGAATLLIGSVLVLASRRRRNSTS